jgi:hypothetical protein
VIVYAVRIHFPRRGRNKRDLVKTFTTKSDAVEYAKRAAAKGKRWKDQNPLTGKMIYGTSPKNPTACVYNLKAWGTPPACYSFKWIGTKIRKPGGPVPSGMKAASVVRVPYTALAGLRRK